MRHDYVGTGHLLLGLAAVDEGLAARILRNRGVGTTELRAAIEDDPSGGATAS
jgi:ATP-dependent Clp protease ATP-binding subunit ClpA